MKVFVVACLFLSLIGSSADADIVYFNDGMKTICQEKAWEEGNQIKCEYEGWVLTYPKKEVLRIVKTKPLQRAAPSGKKDRAYQTTNGRSSSRKFSRPKTNKIAFYNPRRSYKYWTDKNSKHNSYKEAIQAFAKKYDRSPDWIESHMGNTNDLEQIHRNLTGSMSNRQTVDAKPAVPEDPGIPFYNPRRPFPYWTGDDLKHKSYKEAIQTLAQKYGQSTKWVQEHMGKSNDLNQIHENLRHAN